MADQLDQGRAFSRPPLYVSNKNETVRMFESDFMEFFSRVHPMIPLILYLPVVGAMLYVSVWQRQLSLVAVAALFLLGILLWTLTDTSSIGISFITNRRRELGNACTTSSTAFITIIQATRAGS